MSKSLKWFPLLLALVLGGCASVPTARFDGQLSLGEAIDRGLVTAEFRGNGSSTGDAIFLTVRKTRAAGDGRLVLTIAPGTPLAPARGSDQNMVISHVRGLKLDATHFSPLSEIALTDRRSVTYLLVAYCTTFQGNNPSRSSRFSLGESSPVIVCILRQGRSRGLSMQAIQAAVWIVTDNLSFEQMNARFPVNFTDWLSGQTVANACRR